MGSILFKTVYEKSFIQKEAQTSIANAMQYCFYDDMIETFIEGGCKNTNKALQENAYNYCASFVKLSPPNFFNYGDSETKKQVLFLFVQ